MVGAAWSASHHHGAGLVLLLEQSGERSHHHGAGLVLPTVLSANPKPGMEKRSPEGRSRSDGPAGMKVMSLMGGFPDRGVPLILGPVDHQICGMDARLLTGGI